MDIFEQGNIALYRQALTVRSEQIEAITSNIANEHTPGYKAKQVSFESMITQQGGVKTTQSKHITVSSISSEVLSNESGGLDANTVDGLQERMNFVEVSTQYQMVQEFFAAHMSGIKTAFKGRD